MTVCVSLDNHGSTLLLLGTLYLDWFFCSDLLEGYKAAELNTEEHLQGERSLFSQCQAVADMKFSYVVSCQKYGIHKRSGDPRAQDILKLMTTYVF